MKEKNSRYLKYLPTIYQQSVEKDNINSAEGFVGQYLKIFEKIFSGISDQTLEGQKGLEELLSANVIGNLFYPRFSFLFKDNPEFIPPLINAVNALQEFSQYVPLPLQSDTHSQFVAWLNDFINWLAGWVALKLDQDWNIDRKRLMIAQIMPIYRMRGTLQGLQKLLDLSIEQGKIITVKVEHPPKAASLQVGVNFILQDTYTIGSGIIGGKQPFLFIVNVYMDEEASIADIQAMIQKARQIINYAKPEFSYFKLHLFPTLQLNKRAALDKNSLLGSASIHRIYLNEKGNLGKTAILG